MNYMQDRLKWNVDLRFITAYRRITSEYIYCANYRRLCIIKFCKITSVNLEIVDRVDNFGHCLEMLVFIKCCLIVLLVRFAGKLEYFHSDSLFNIIYYLSVRKPTICGSDQV